MSGRIKIKPKNKDKKPKIDVFKVIENRFKNMNELRDLIDMDPRKGLVRIRDGAGFREVERGGCLQQIGIPHRHWLLYNNPPPCYKITMPSYTTVTCNLIIKFRHVSEIDDLLRIGYLRYRSKFSYPMPV